LDLSIRKERFQKQGDLEGEKKGATGAGDLQQWQGFPDIVETGRDS